MEIPDGGSARMVEGPYRLDGILYREGGRPGGPELRNELRVVRTVEAQVREAPRRRGIDRGRAFLALVVVTAVVAGAVIIDLSLRQPPNRRPTSSLNADRVLVFPGESVLFDGSGSADPDGSIASCEWRIFPGGLCETKRPTLVRSFDRPGIYNISLRVVDDRDDRSNHSQLQVAVVPRPAASASGALTHEEVEFSVDNSTLSAAPVSFGWNFSDGTPDAGGPAVRHAFSDNGNYTVRFRASFLGEQLEAPLRLNISNRPPSAFFNLTEPGPYYTNHVWTFDGSRCSDPDGSVVAWAWDFGDGTVDSINGSVVGHSFARAGIFRAVLRLTDDDGAVALMTRELVVGKDLYIVLVTAETYLDLSGAPRANLTVRFDNPGDAKPPGAVRLTVTAHTPAQNDIADPQSQAVDFHGSEVPAGSTGLLVRVGGLLISSYLPEKTWYLVELGCMSSVVDTRWYQKY
jgi:PKD repeat protein